MCKFRHLLIIFFLVNSTFSWSQSDTISENFNGICEHTTTPGRTYSIDYTGEQDIIWDIKTFYSSSSWWGGIDDYGAHVEGTVHCGSLQWDETSSGYARARMEKGITSLSFQLVYGFQLVGGYVKVMIDGIEVGRTEELEDKEVHSYTFPLNITGPFDLELVPVVESSTPGGLILDNLEMVISDSIPPFFSVEKLDDFDPWMDTLSQPLETMQIYVYAEHCLEVNGEFVDYFDLADDVDLKVGSVIDLVPGDSCNIYYWGSVKPGIGNDTDNPEVDMYLPVNNSLEEIGFDTSAGEDSISGMLSFINGNIDMDLVVFRLSDAKNEYKFTYSFDSYEYIPADTTGSDSTLSSETIINNVKPAVHFYPNPVQNYAYFETTKNLNYYEVFDLNGKLLHYQPDPVETPDGKYSLDLRSLQKGIWIIRFFYNDNTVDAIKVTSR